LDGLLSQWRGYARGGFSIEFDEIAIDELTRKENTQSLFQGIFTNEVRYRDFERFINFEEFHGFAAALFKSVLEQVLPNSHRRLVEILGSKSPDDFAQAYLSTEPFLKNGGFEEEREYRIVALCNRAGVKGEGDQRDHKPINFRATSDGRAVPFIKLFDSLPDALPIKAIIIGPHPHQDSQLNAVNLMLSEYGLKADVRQSRIPFRE
jgi:hypothetical protein